MHRKLTQPYLANENPTPSTTQRMIPPTCSRRSPHQTSITPPCASTAPCNMPHVSRSRGSARPRQIAKHVLCRTVESVFLPSHKPCKASIRHGSVNDWAGTILMDRRCEESSQGMLRGLQGGGTETDAHTADTTPVIEPEAV